MFIMSDTDYSGVRKRRIDSKKRLSNTENVSGEETTKQPGFDVSGMSPTEMSEFLEKRRFIADHKKRGSNYYKS